MADRPIVPINCFFQGCYNPAYEEEIRKAKEKCFRYNQLSPNDREAQEVILRELLGKMGTETVITPPMWWLWVSPAESIGKSPKRTKPLIPSTVP